MKITTNLSRLSHSSCQCGTDGCCSDRIYCPGVSQRRSCAASRSSRWDRSRSPHTSTRSRSTPDRPLRPCTVELRWVSSYLRAPTTAADTLWKYNTTTEFIIRRPLSKAPFTRYNLLSNRLSNGFDNRVNVCMNDTTGCQTRSQTGYTTRFDNRLNEQLFVQHGC